VAEQFASNFARGLEEDAQCVAYVKEEKVVDLWGSADLTYGPDSLAMVFSSTKVTDS